MKKNYYLKKLIAEVFPEPGIYRLFKMINSHFNLVYIGQGVNLRKRLMEHNRTFYMKFDYFDYDFYPRIKLDEIERTELNKYKEKYGCWPKYNNRGGNKRCNYAKISNISVD